MEFGEGVKKKQLNPFAKEWDLAKERAPEEERSLYIISSMNDAHTLTEQEITHFFVQNFGGCIERVDMDAIGGVFAKVVFQFSSIPARVLGNMDEGTFFLNSKIVWCTRYDPRDIHTNYETEITWI